MVAKKKNSEDLIAHVFPIFLPKEVSYLLILKCHLLAWTPCYSQPEEGGDGAPNFWASD